MVPLGEQFLAHTRLYISGVITEFKWLRPSFAKKPAANRPSKIEWPSTFGATDDARLELLEHMCGEALAVVASKANSAHGWLTKVDDLEVALLRELLSIAPSIRYGMQRK